MPARSTVSRLPPELRDELDRRLIAGGFSDYTGLTDWLAGEGYEISRSAVHRHGRRVEERIEQIRIATDEAKAIEKAAEDDGESISFSILIQCQVMLHRIALAVEEGDAKLACQQARALADVTRAGVTLRKERKLGRQEAVRIVDGKLERAEEEAAAGGDPMEAIRRVRREVYGILDD